MIVYNDKTEDFIINEMQKGGRGMSGVGINLLGPMYTRSNPGIKKVIFNPPATIVLWKDGTKTVVKAAEDDEYNKWAGLALCMAKKQLGDEFHKVFKEWCKEDEEEKEKRDGYTNPFLDALYRSCLHLYQGVPVTEKEEEK